MNKNVQILDCTLRDGGHLNGGNFGEKIINKTISKLVEAKVDIIEVGFMWDKPNSKDITRYYSISDIKRILPKNIGKSKISVMLEKPNLLEHIEENDGTIEYIRVIFKRHLIDWAIKTVEELHRKGYKCFLNPVNCTVYTDEEYIELIKKVNEIRPYAISIVDTFGTMRIEELEKRYKLVEQNLSKDIVIGVHLHENLGLSYAMAQRVLEIANPNRNLVIDASLMGMGRDPGNLKIEQITEYINYKNGRRYEMDSIYDLIDEEYSSLKNNYGWGFSIPYAMGAYYDLHRTYPEYLSKKKDLLLKDINFILSKIERSEAEYYNEAYVEELYQLYKKGELK